jgi:hypothetical protein
MLNRLLVPSLLTALLLCHPVRAQEAPPVALRQPIGYVTERGQRLPLLQYDAYQSARHRWTAGFITTLSGLALMGTGVGLLAAGGHATETLTERGRADATIAGGVIFGIGAAGVGVGAALWHLGRRDLLLLEKGLPPYVPSVALSPTGASLGLSGRF